ncbi:MAG: hypothetical protein DHS20C02_10290 [Micavibrio sp.]|nr:MAG: hypothetical protein DHS20C02_10290 [Micavibrio sp.]
MNEAAFAYYRHCESQSGAIDKKFMVALELVANELFDQTKTDNPRRNPEHIKAKILERRHNIQYSLDHAHKTEGCSSKGAKTAQTHYIEFSRYDQHAIRAFIYRKTRTQ